jgi:UDP-N-acetylglucosamine 4,6-dehydratase/5-epimerase
MSWANKKVLLTGGTGSFGHEFVRIMLQKYNPEVIRIYSRDEWKQVQMRQKFPDSRLRFLIGDVRDADRLHRAMSDVDIVVHAAALKHVPVCEYNPIEAVHTNVMGSENVINAALDSGVKKVIAVSTDKAVNPVNLYGATKLCAEKLFVAANAYTGRGQTRFSIVRYGNVMGSRGSVIPLFQEQRRNGTVTITDGRMTRFWVTLEQGVELVARCAEMMQGGEIFIPKIPSMSLTKLADVVAPGCKRNIVGIRPGEKIHEVLIVEDEARQTLEFDDLYVVEPSNPSWNRTPLKGGRPVAPDFRYSSDTNPQQLTENQLREVIAALDEKSK